MIAYKTKKYWDVLPKLVNNYNNRIHSSTNIKPNNFNEKKEEDISMFKLLEYNYIKQNIDENFKIGDKVRILKIRKTFSKGEKETYSKKIYEIINKEGNKYIIKSGNVTKSVFPFQMKLINKDIIENPYLNNNKDKIEKEKNILEKDKKKKRQTRKIKKEGLDTNEKVNVRKKLTLRPQNKIKYY